MTPRNPQIVVGTRLIVSKRYKFCSELVAWSWGKVVKRTARTLTIEVDKDDKAHHRFNAVDGTCIRKDYKEDYEVSFAHYVLDSALNEVRLVQLRSLVSRTAMATKDDATLMAALVVLAARAPR
jgi:hypothetical protein